MSISYAIFGDQPVLVSVLSRLQQNYHFQQCGVNDSFALVNIVYMLVYSAVSDSLHRRITPGPTHLALGAGNPPP